MASFNCDRYVPLVSSKCLIYTILSIILAIFIILTIVFGTLWARKDKGYPPQTTSSNYAVAKGIIGFPPSLPNDGRYVQWTFLQMNDVYELLPLNQGQKGGLARVAYIRKLLLDENNNTITVLAGDLISPSALGTARVNGSALNGKQMIATMNTLGLNYSTFGNHEFDYDEATLSARMNESTFTWISSNVLNANTSQPFISSLTHKILTIDSVRILLIAYTIEGTGNYVRYIEQASLVNYTKQFLTQFPRNTYDVLVLLTHLDIATDINLASSIPEINVILGGHEHEDYYYLRGPNFTPIYKADANAVTVYIHRCAFNIDTKQFRIYSTLARVSSEVPEENKTAEVANYWFNLGMQGFRASGYEPSEIVSCLTNGVELDGRAESVRYSQTLLSDTICEAMIAATASSKTTICVFNSGAIRIDDVLSTTITQYDVLRVLPFENNILALSVPGQLLAQVLSTGMSLKGNGMFLSYTGITKNDEGATWLVDGVNIATSGKNYTVATIQYAKTSTGLNSTTIIGQANVAQTRATIDYLKMKYPPC